MASQDSLRRRKKKELDKNSENSSNTIKDAHKNIDSDIVKSFRYKKLETCLTVSLFAVRILGAIYSNINDCDEVFNYWEPTHFFQYKHGLQTWEYSPLYAIRSWAYIIIHYLPLAFFGFFTSSKVVQFYSLRVLLAVISGCFELFLFQSISSFLSPELGIFTLVFLLGSSGLFHAAPAYLPSSFAMLTTMVFFLNAIIPVKNFGRRNRALQALGVGCLLGWPFSAAIGIPFAFEEIFSPEREGNSQGFSLTSWLKNFTELFLSSLKYFLYIMVPIVLVDYYFYKKITLVPFNIVLYNVIGASEDSGPNIFGTEPWFFYVLNLFLNFNLGFILALVSILLLLLDSLIFRQQFVFGSVSHISLGFRIIPVYWWLLIYSSQPHKEERFMFIIYPLLAFNAAVSLFLVYNWGLKFSEKLFNDNLGVQKGIKNISKFIVVTCFILFLSLSFLRTYGQYTYYNAPMKLYTSIKDFVPVNAQVENTLDSQNKLLCLGDEWYRFPSHYFLPENTRLSFVKAGFDGLLPKPFILSDSLLKSTSIIPTTMNNKNKEEFDRYISPDKCDLMILNLPVSNKKNQVPVGWEIVECQPFLDPKSLPSWRRAFYIPSFKSLSPPLYDSYCILQQIKKD